LVEITLVLLLIARRDYREFPAFFSYISADLLQACIMLVIYLKYGFLSKPFYWVGWGTQAVVLTARGLAVVEICRHLLGRYRGVWELIWRVLFAVAFAVVLYASLTARHEWFMFVPNFRRSIELAIATGIVGLFLFARYYEIVPEPLLRSLAIGFFLISCFWVLNATVLERLVQRYIPLWTFLNVLATFASLLVWTWAFRQPRVAVVERPLLTGEPYRTISPEVNLRLRHLNEQLSRFWKVDGDQR
jgi:hypothetical protein